MALGSSAPKGLPSANVVLDFKHYVFLLHGMPDNDQPSEDLLYIVIFRGRIPDKTD